MAVKKLTDEQVQMLIDDGTLVPVIEKEKPLEQNNCDFVNTIKEIEQFQVNALPNTFIDNYSYLLKMLAIGVLPPAQTEEELYLARNLIIGRYHNFVQNILRDLKRIIKNDIKSRFNKDTCYTNYNDNLYFTFENNLSNLEFMNYFITSIDDYAKWLYIQGFIENIAYAPPDTFCNTTYSNNVKQMYSYFNDIATVVTLICDAARICLAALGNYNRNIINGNLILQPYPYDLSEPLNSEYNRLRCKVFEQEQPVPKKRLYTINHVDD